MKKLFTLILFLLSLTPTLVAQTSEPAGSAPEAGKSYYLYNVDKGQYLSAGSDGTLTLGSPYLEVTLSQPTKTTTADADFYTIEANGKKMLAALWQAPVLGDSKQNYYDQWQVSAVSGKANVYTLGCRNRAAGSMMYMYWNDTKDALSTVLLKIWTSFDNGQWKLVSEADVEKQVITLDETAGTYAPTTINSEATVHLKRTLSQNCWNSFCVPFDIDATQLKAQFGDDVKVAELTGMTSTTFDFTSVTDVKAGTPYLLYTSADAPTEGYYTFTGVTSLLSSPTSKTVSNGDESITYQGCFCNTTATKGAYVLRKKALPLAERHDHGRLPRYAHPRRQQCQQGVQLLDARQLHHRHRQYQRRKRHQARCLQRGRTESQDQCHHRQPAARRVYRERKENH